MAPYLFVYHHRVALRNFADENQGDYASNISSLLSYINSQYGEEYEDADTKFAEGIVTLEHFTKLWVPNEMIVTRKNDQVFVHVVKNWLTVWDNRYFERGQQKHIDLQCWSWEYDGFSLKRNNTTQRVDLADHQEISINKLRTLPFRFAPEQLKTALMLRGRKSWGFRHKHLVNYTGHDFNRELYYVGYRVSWK